MDKKSKNSCYQYIGCTVESCKYNECDEHCCSLSQIQVSPVQGKKTARPDESMCASYECDCNNHNKKTDNYFG